MDLKVLAKRLDLEVVEFLDFVELFLETSDSDLEALHSAIDERNPEHAAEAAHSIKGAAANLGFKKISQAAASVEMKARENRLDGVSESAGEIKASLGLLAESYRSISLNE